MDRTVGEANNLLGLVERHGWDWNLGEYGTPFMDNPRYIATRDYYKALENAMETSQADENTPLVGEQLSYYHKLSDIYRDTTSTNTLTKSARKNK